MQYSNFKDTLQNIASQIGNVEQEVEEHKYVTRTLNFLCLSEPGDSYQPTSMAFAILASTTAKRRLDHQYHILLIRPLNGPGMLLLVSIRQRS
jgi:hypothetical protein